MARDPRHDCLFEPLRIGPKTLRNRFYQVPHCCGFGTEKPLHQAHFRAMKAEGGWAAVCTEYCAISPDSDETPFISARLWDDDDVRALAVTCDLAHEHGALAGCELHHSGAHSPRRQYSPAGPGSLAAHVRLPPRRSEGDGEVGHPPPAGRLGGGRAAGALGRLRHRLRVRRPQLPADAVPVALLQQAHRRVRRRPRESRPLLARDARGRARGGRRGVRHRGPHRGRGARPVRRRARRGTRVHPARRPPRRSLGRQRRAPLSSGRRTRAPPASSRPAGSCPGRRGRGRRRRSRSWASAGSRIRTRWRRSSRAASGT